MICGEQTKFGAGGRGGGTVFPTHLQLALQNV